jgi:2,4-didehydro-3-deoxy-L-rhamnonate hydrolase
MAGLSNSTRLKLDLISHPSTDFAVSKSVIFMKLFQYLAENQVKRGVIFQEKTYDVSAMFADFDSIFFEKEGLSMLEDYLVKNAENLPQIALPSTLLAPFATPSKIICVGLNYADHARETGATPPSEPVLFLKASTAFCGPFDAIELPRNSVKTDWEVELAVVIKKRAKYVSEAEAMDFVAGYCVHNDVSEREFQLERGGTWDKGKGCDTFAPMGPYLVTPDEIDEVHELDLWLTVNGQMMQQSNTKNLIFNIPTLISYISQFMTLLPGDVISTGTPHGVGLGMKPPVYLQKGDVVELGIQGLGVARQEVV